MKTPEAAWLMLCAAVALHVADEAVFGFLDYYNPLVESIPWLPMPAFSFAVWITGLIVAILIGLVATVLVKRRQAAVRWVGIVIGVIMVFNGLGHATYSVLLGELVAGTLSSPFLILAAAWVILRFVRDWSAPSDSPV